VISVESLYHDEGIPWIVTAVIGGSMLTEFLVSRTQTQDVHQTPRMERARTPLPIDELEAEQEHDEIDELDDGDSEPHAGPIYRDEPATPPPRDEPT
jgi:hypothetical protein